VSQQVRDAVRQYSSSRADFGDVGSPDARPSTSIEGTRWRHGSQSADAGCMSRSRSKHSVRSGDTDDSYADAYEGAVSSQPRKRIGSSSRGASSTKR
jgi:hypothetical protein